MAVQWLVLSPQSKKVFCSFAQQYFDILYHTLIYHQITQCSHFTVHTAEEPFIIDDIAYENENQRNADPCTSSGCMWGKSSDGNVYVPYVIASHYSSRERSIIERGLLSFQDVSCIRFVPRTNQRDYLNIQSINGCYSYVGRLGYGQAVSLDRQGCLYHNTVQHELLHALGFNHEQCRSDRDQHIRILWENIASGWAYAFDKINTLNQNTPYDYNSVMQYHRSGSLSSSVHSVLSFSSGFFLLLLFFDNFLFCCLCKINQGFFCTLKQM
uniref:Metalloendopeptidase n=1 Tax=Haplochromis burtoni TaxID=8153 RepID=A0A3Q2VN40_HAPBU